MTAFTVGLAAHLSVVKTMPADESHVSRPPERVPVWFNQQPSPRVSRLELRGHPPVLQASGNEVAIESIELAYEGFRLIDISR